MRDETILTDLIEQSLELRLSSSRVSLPVAGTSAVVADAEPQRLCLLVVPDDPSVHVYLGPNAMTGPGILPTSLPPSSLLIHAAAYPLLVSQSWHAVAVAPVDLTVYSVTRET